MKLLRWHSIFCFTTGLLSYAQSWWRSWLSRFIVLNIMLIGPRNWTRGEGGRVLAGGCNCEIMEILSLCVYYTVLAMKSIDNSWSFIKENKKKTFIQTMI